MSKELNYGVKEVSKSACSLLDLLVRAVITLFIVVFVLIIAVGYLLFEYVFY